MINLRRLDVIRIFALSALLLTPLPYLGRSSNRRSPIRWPRPTASTHLGKSREFATPFNVERPGVNVSRTWEWNPKEKIERRTSPTGADFTTG